jgi:hypothetical protein
MTTFGITLETDAASFDRAAFAQRIANVSGVSRQDVAILSVTVGLPSSLNVTNVTAVHARILNVADSVTIHARIVTRDGLLAGI